jgi:hypothetical protein
MKTSKKLSISHTVYPIDYDRNNRQDQTKIKEWRDHVFIESGMKSDGCKQFLVAARLIVGGSYK